MLMNEDELIAPVKKTNKMEEKSIIAKPGQVFADSLISKIRKRISKYKYLILAAVVLLSITIYFILFQTSQAHVIKEFVNKDHHLFYWMLLLGFFAELVAGSMGMGYGVICTTTLLILNLPAPAISASIHSAESFTSAAGAISHYQYKNVNKKLVRLLAIPGAIGAIIGALALIQLGHHSPKFMKPLLALYTMYLGIRILMNAFTRKSIGKNKKKVNIPVLAVIGGFIDSFGGGGWGPLVTGTFVKAGRTPRFVIGSSSFAKFVLTLASAFTFIFAGGFSQWNIVAGLLIGGVVTAPFSALITSRFPVKRMFIFVGIVVIGCSLITLGRFISTLF
jgi:hypothetical protein